MAKEDMDALREDGIDLAEILSRKGPVHNSGAPRLGETMLCGELVCMVTSVGWDAGRVTYIHLTPLPDQARPSCPCESCAEQPVKAGS